MFMLRACSVGSPSAAEGRMEDLSARIARTYPRDLLRAFGGATHSSEPIPIPIPIQVPVPAGEGEMGGIELNLGLSLGGCFGAEPGGGADKRLVRSSSLAAFSIFPFGEFDHAPADGGALARTCSLPTEADEEQRKRKAMQGLKRLEAKRKRLERRNSRAGSDEDVASGHGSIEAKPVANGLINGASSSYRGSPKCESRISRRSSSGLSSIDSHALQGLTITTDSKGPSIKPPLPEHDNHKADTNPTAATMPRTMNYAAEENGLTLKADKKANMFVGEADRYMMEEMPSVSTRGDGPNGKKIEGFLYKYKKGESVRIVCICHGKFHTPAEFVKHAGGSDVAHPLKHIVVNP